MEKPNWLQAPDFLEDGEYKPAVLLTGLILYCLESNIVIYSCAEWVSNVIFLS